VLVGGEHEPQLQPSGLTLEIAHAAPRPDTARQLAQNLDLDSAAEAA
jgi:hypothetical protein